jgi:hypothetical protein
MVRRLLALALLCLGALAQAAQIGLELPTAERPYRAELGRAFTLQLHYRGEADLERIALDPWQQDFAVDRGYVRREGYRQQLRLRLTPRRTGLLSLPPLQLGPASSDGLTVHSGPALEADESLEPAWQLSPQRAWQGQEIRASLTLDSRLPGLRLTTAEANWPGFSIRALPADRISLDDGRVRHRFSWLLRARQDGSHRLAAPELRYLRDGLPVRRFRFPLAELRIDAAPDYLPPTVPLGRLAAETDAEGIQWLLGHGVPAEQLRAALDRGRLPQLGIATQYTDAGTLSRARIDWSATATDTARLVFFDPATGRLNQLTLTAPPPSRILWLLAPALILLALLGWQGRRLWAYQARWAARRRLLQRLAGTTDADALKAVLLDRDQTLRQWQAAWQADYHVPASLAAVLLRLEACCYGGEHSDADMARTLRDALRRSRPRW